MTGPQRPDRAAGDMEGRAVWLRIMKAVKELLDDRPPSDGEAVY